MQTELRPMEELLDLFEEYFEATTSGSWDAFFWATDEYDDLVRRVEEALGREVSVKDC